MLSVIFSLIISNFRFNFTINDQNKAQCKTELCKKYQV